MTAVAHEMIPLLIRVARRASVAAALAASLCRAPRVGADEGISLAMPPGALPAIAGESVTQALLQSPAAEGLATGQAEEIQTAPAAADDRPFRPITQVTVDAALPAGLLPGQPGAQPQDYKPELRPEFSDARFWRGWAQTDFQWAATGLCHRPLYFEEVNLERYGYTLCPALQPAISGAHFFLTIPTLPYKMTRQCPRECVYTLGHYRPGSPAPWRKHCMDLAWDPTAVAVEGLVVTGLVFLIP